MANLTKCAICDNSYSYCPNCSTAHAWKFYTDTHECYQIFMALMQYKKGFESKDKTKEALEYLGITLESDFSKYKPSIAKEIKEILTVEEKVDEPIDKKTVLKKDKKSKLYKD